MYGSSAGNIVKNRFTFDNVSKFSTCVGRIREFSIFVGIYPTPPYICRMILEYHKGHSKFPAFFIKFKNISGTF